MKRELSTADGFHAAFAPRASRAELAAQGKELRRKCPRGSHARWKAPEGRPDPVDVVRQADHGRIPELIPIRHGRMLASPFAFYRASAGAMAADLAALPATGARVQCCGDAHLSNFLCFATPERRIIFDVQDLDETLPGPWEWDLKRLAVSFVLASRDCGLSEGQARDAALLCARSYREHMARLADMGPLEIWYARLDADQLAGDIEDDAVRRRAKKRLAQARERTALSYDFPKLAEDGGGVPRIKDHPPLIYHMKDGGQKKFTDSVREAFASYRASLPEERRVLLDRYELKDISVKVVGVGSVGTLCGIMLLTADGRDPLFLQIKQAGPSALEPFLGKSAYANHGQRVVMGHRLMQSASDLFLGWTQGRQGRHFYIRQLRDAKIKFAVEDFGKEEMRLFAGICGATLARAHARSGEPAVIAGYLGKGDRFDEAAADFSTAYADQVEEDHASVLKAAKAGKLKVLVERDA